MQTFRHYLTPLPVLRLLFVAIGTFQGSSCQQNPEELALAHDIAIWTLKGNFLAGQECKIDTNRLEPIEKLIANEDILSYQAADHYFTLTAAGINRLKGINKYVPFCLKVDGRILYTGLLMPGYLSLYCPGIIIDPISSVSNTLRVGYHYAAAWQPGDDLRNHASFLAALQDQGKLKK